MVRHTGSQWIAPRGGKSVPAAKPADKKPPASAIEPDEPDDDAGQPGEYPPEH
jgi:hypothetical protein